MSDQIVLYDACVLYPAPLRDLLVRVALTDLVQVHWTEEIHREWMRNLLENRPDLSAAQLERTRQAMNAAVTDSVVEGYEELIPQLHLPDADDRHVLAAAIHTRAQVIVTFNLKDFPVSALAPYGLVARHPDDFLGDLLTMDARAVVETIIAQCRALRRPPKTLDEHLETLQSNGLVKTVTRVKHWLESKEM